VRTFASRSRFSHRRETANARSGRVLEAIAPPLRRLLDRPPEVLPLQRQQRGQLAQHRGQGLLLAATDEEVVPQGEQDMDVGLGGQTPQERGEALLHLRRVQGEQLLELVHDEERFPVAPPPATQQGDRRVGLLEAGEHGERFGVAGQLRAQRLPQAPEGMGAGGADECRPSFGPGREDSGSDERGLARPRGADHGEEPAVGDSPPQLPDLALAAEEDRGVLLREGAQPRIGAPLLDLAESGRGRGGGQDRLQNHGHVVTRGVAVFLCLLQAPTHDPAHRRRNRPRQGLQDRRRLFHDRGERPRHRVLPEGVLAGQQLVEDDPEGEDVGAGVDGQGPGLLGGHVEDGPCDLAGGSGARGRRDLARDLRLRAHELGQAEVEDLHPTVRGQEEVLGLEVAVDDALGVGGLEAAGGLEGVAEDLLSGGGAAGDELAQRIALEELGDDVGSAVVGPRVVDGENVGVVQGGDGAGLALEESEARGVGRHL
jgi:hypothetical protein